MDARVIRAARARATAEAARRARTLAEICVTPYARAGWAAVAQRLEDRARLEGVEHV